ncbi:uncharacterized protein GJ701_017063 [Geothlypis trichas]
MGDRKLLMGKHLFIKRLFPGIGNSQRKNSMQNKKSSVHFLILPTKENHIQKCPPCFNLLIREENVVVGYAEMQFSGSALSHQRQAWASYTGPAFVSNLAAMPESPKLPLICESAFIRFYKCSCYFLFSLILAYLPAAANVNGLLWHPARPIREVAHVRIGKPRTLSLNGHTGPGN